MHIFEIIDARTITQKSDKEFTPAHGQTYFDIIKDPKHIESGAFALVKKHDDPHMVSRESRGTEETLRDGYWIYAQYVMKYKLWENPYFPRMYLKTKTHYANKEEIDDIVIEKLQELSTLNSKEVNFLHRKIFGESVTATSPKEILERIEEEVDTLKFRGSIKNYDVNYVKAARVSSIKLQLKKT